MTKLVINFHGIGTPHGWVDSDEAKYWLSADDFHRVIDRVKSAVAEFEITFDDGNVSDFEIAVPALLARNLTARFFVCSARIGRPGYLDGAALGEMVRAGFDIGIHGRHHIPWRGLPSHELADEIIGSKSELEAVIQRHITAAGLPFGQYDRNALRQLCDAGITTVYSSDGAPRLRQRGPVPRQSLRSDIPLDRQIETAIAGSTLPKRLLQEVRIMTKSLL